MVEYSSLSIGRIAKLEGSLEIELSDQSVRPAEKKKNLGDEN